MEELESPPSEKLNNPLKGERITELKIAQLGPDGITVYDSAIRDAISRAVPERMMKRIERIQDTIILDLRSARMQAWMLGTPIDGRVNMCGFVFTKIQLEHLTGERQLNLISICMFYPYGPEVLKQILPVLDKYAANSQCTTMVTTVDVKNRRAIMGAQELEFDAVSFTGYRRVKIWDSSA